MPISSSVIFCDDIRLEMSGKMLFIGVYPSDLVPSVLPQILALSFWVRITGLPPGYYDLHFAVGANGTSQIEAGIALAVEEGKDVSHLTLIGLPIELKDFGNIFITLTGLPNGETIHAELPVIPAKPVGDQSATA